MKNQERHRVTRELLEKYKRDPNPEVLNELLRVNLGLIQSIVRKTCCHNAYFDDALQEAMLNFCKAVEYYDLSRNTPFASYCAFYIRSAIYKWLNWNAQSIRVPRGSLSDRRFMTARQEFYNEFGRMPTREELAERLNVSPNLLELREYAEKVRNVLSVDAMDEVNLERLELQTAYVEFVEDDEETLTPEQKSILAQLTDEEREILLERVCDGRLVRDIAKARGIKPSEAKRIIHGALVKCREYAERLGLGDTGLSFEQELKIVHERRGRNKKVG